MSAAGNYRLVADIGGTNARFAVATWADGQWRLLAERAFIRNEFDSLEAAIQAFLRELRSAQPTTAVVAVAGPVTDGVADLTNGQWRMSEKAVAALGFRKVALINDYAALAYAAQALNEHDLVPIGAEGAAVGTIAVIGAGTGLGVSALIADGRSTAVAVTEGGHVAFAPGDAVEAEILHHLSSRFERVSLERILSGPGLSNLHWALGRIDGRDDALMAPSDLVGSALTDKDAACLETLDRFCRIYGACAGDMALALGAVGGVYLAGGIAPRILAQLQASGFRSRFEAKGRLSDYVRRIPTKVVVHPFAALIGAAAYPLEAPCL